MYWIPKLHKNPTKARFIVAAPNCSIKPLSKAVTQVLKLMFKQIEMYNHKSTYFSGVKSFWPIQNNQPVIEAIKKLNGRSKANSISTFDFSTLYTNIPHAKLKNVLRELINFCFKGGDKKYIAITKFGATWTNNKHKYNVTFDKPSLKLAINYLLDNCYFNLGNMSFRQVIGIPMGSDPAPFMANLFLYFYENKWLLELKKKDLHKARLFSNTFRFIDDLCTINDNNEFERNYQQIYPVELELKKENNSNLEASFLDLSITLENKHFNTKLFDKRDAFPFSIVRMPDLNGNILCHVFYGSIFSEFLRIARATLKYMDFLPKSRELVERMQGATENILLKQIDKMVARYPDAVETFNVNSRVMKLDLSPTN